MKSVNGNCLFAQSGGPTTVINASAYGIIKEFLSHESTFKIYAGLYGIQGILEKNIVDAGSMDKNALEALKYTPSAAFGSCRYKLKDFKENEEDYKKLIEIFKEFNIRYFFYIGGNDSMDAASKISSYAESTGYDIRIIGVPKTIDNDLVETDHCPGFGSAAKYIINAGLELWLDMNSYKKESVIIMEVMGRDAGWIAASSGMLKKVVPDINLSIYLPEIPFDKIRFLENTEKVLHSNNNKLLIVTSEGLRGSDGQYINVESNCYSNDAFGHTQLGGIGKCLQQYIKDNVTRNVKLTEVGVIQRCAEHCASHTDIEEAEMAGRASLKYALEGRSGFMTALKRKLGEEYNCFTELARLEDVCNKVKNVPASWINSDNSGVSCEMINYVKPLIAGSINNFSENGIIKYTDLGIR